MKRYNSKLRKHVTLNDGEKFCPKCFGKGKVPKEPRNKCVVRINLICDVCLGDGKLDWIEEATGKKVRRVMLYER